MTTKAITTLATRDLVPLAVLALQHDLERLEAEPADQRAAIHVRSVKASGLAILDLARVNDHARHTNKLLDWIERLRDRIDQL